MIPTLPRSLVRRVPRNRLGAALFAVLLGGTGVAQAQAPATTCLKTSANPTGVAISGNWPSTPNSALVDNGNGTITHTTTGLIWKKCPEGRTYSGGICTGGTGSYSWQQALRRAVNDSTAGQTDWRLPSRNELLSIVETACSTPTINVARFPNVPGSGMFWTSSHAGAAVPNSVWGVRFNTGSSVLLPKTMSAFALLVRSGWNTDDSYRAPAPTEPAAFTFASQIAQPGDTATSNTVTMSGLTASRSISISGSGEYRINGGAWTTTSGSIANGNTLQLKIVAPNTVPSSRAATVNVNGRTATFLVTTGTPPPDKVPDPFTFVDQTNVFPGATVTSAPIIVTGINQATTITVSGGSYSINDGGFTSIPGTVMNGDSVRVQHTASSGYLTPVNTTLTIGETGATVSDTFTSTTAAVDGTPDAFAFTDQTGVAISTTRTSNTITVSGINTSVAVSVTGGSYSKNGGGYTSAGGTAVNGDTFTVRHTASASYSTAVNTTLTIGGVSDTFTSTTYALDTTPDAFAFTDQADVARSTLITSSSITVAGINGPANISITGGSYSKNGGGYTSGAGTVVNGDTVTVQHTSSGSYSTDTNTTLIIGGVSDVFTSTTLAAPGDTVPDAFSFTDQNPVALSTLITSDTLTVAGISAAASISVTGGEYQINGGAWTTTAGTITPGQTFAVRHTSSATELTATNTTLNIGGVTDVFTSTTGDKTPTAFSFTDQNPVALSTVITSNTLTVAGITIPATISVTGGEYQINGGAWTTTAGTISNGNTFAVRHTSSGAQTTAVNTVLTIGGTVSDTFTSTSGDSIPNGFSFTDETNVPVSTVKTSNAITVAGITIPTAISVTGGTYNINGGAYTSTAGTVSNGDTVTVQHTSSASNSTATDTILTIGGVSDTYTTTTAAPPCGTATWAAASFANTSNDKTSNCTTTIKPLTNLCANTSYTFTRSVSGSGGGSTAAMDYSIDGGTNWITAASGTVSATNSVRFRFTQQNKDKMTYTYSMTIGGVTRSWAHNTDGSGTCTPP